MKKIMKKAFSLMLALVMVFTLAPMTANAAETPTLTIGGGIQTAVYDGMNNCGYLYTPTGDGELKVEFADHSWMCNIYEGTRPSMATVTTGTGEFTTDSQNYVTANLTAGTTYYVQIQTYDYSAGNVMFMTSYIESSAGGGSVVTGDGTRFNPYDITTVKTTTVSVGTAQYYKITGLDAGKDYTLNVSANSQFMANYEVTPMGAETPAYPMMGRVSTTVTADLSGEVMFILQDYTAADTFTFDWVVVEEETTTNSIDNPEVITEMGTYNDESPESNSYWYKWIATADGVLTVTTTSADGFIGFVVNDSWDCVTEAVENGTAVMVEENDVVVFYVNPGNSTTVNMTASFAPGATIETDDILGGEEETNFEMSDTAFIVGDNTLSGPSSYLYTYTVHEFAPGEIGKYTFTTDDSQIGIVSTNGMWVNVGNPGEDYDVNNVPYLVVVEDELVWECTDENQAIWIAVMALEGAANINVTREELVIEEILEIDYAEVMMEKDPEKFTFNGEVEDLDKVIYVADTMEIAKDENGFYHVVPAGTCDEETGEYIGTTPLEDYPLVLVKLNDSVVSLASAIGYGSVVYVHYDENDKADWKYNFNSAIEKYIAASDTDAKLYPLTDDLVAMMVLVGEHQGWYEETGVVGAEFANDGIDPDLLFTFAMYYMEAEEDVDPVVPPVTGDTTNAILWIAVLGLGLVAIAGSVVMKKREF